MNRALVVDDSRAMRMILAKALTEEGFEVSQAAEGRAGLERMERDGGSEIEQVVRALEAGADEHLMKPFAAGSVKDKLRLLRMVE